MVLSTISSLLKIIGLFCKRSLEKRLYSASAKETRNFCIVLSEEESRVWGWLRLVVSLKL